MRTERARKSQNGAGSIDSQLTARRREEILLAACAVFDDIGYANTRIADISGHLGIGQGTLYRYFTGKTDLMGELIDYGVRRVLVAMQEDDGTDARRTIAKFGDQIAAVAHRLLEISAAEPALVRVLLEQAPAVLPDRIAVLFARLSDATVAYLEVGVRHGYIRTSLNLRVVADAMAGAVIPVMRQAARGHLDHITRESTARTMGDFITYGVSDPTLPGLSR